MSSRPMTANTTTTSRDMSRNAVRAKCKRSQPSIDNPADIAVFFANVVTTPSDIPDDWVARNGDNSIFSAFRNVLPEVRTFIVLDEVWE
jgi:hypothetical protein